MTDDCVAAASEYVLGTAQMGSAYGIANRQGELDAVQVDHVVAAAWSCGVRQFDTAQAYGESEQRLGAALERLGLTDTARVITKLDPRLDYGGPEWVTSSVKTSLQRLRVSRLDSIMLHRFSWLAQWENGLGAALLSLRDRGQTARLGVSTYGLEEVKRALDHPAMEVIQVNANPWEPELLLEGVLAEASEAGRTIYVRSLFLQGLLLMTPEGVAERLPVALPALQEWLGFCREQGTTPFEWCMRFAATLKCPVVLGAETETQVRANARLLEAKPLSVEEVRFCRERVRPHLSRDILDPSRWSTN